MRLELSVNRTDGDSSTTIGIVRIEEDGAIEVLQPLDAVTLAKVLGVLNPMLDEAKAAFAALEA